MKNKKYIWIGFFVLSILLLTYSYKDIKLYYYVKMGNKNYYSKNYEKAIEYYEKALKIKEDYNIRINLIITDYQMKNYKKVLESPVENGFLKGNSLVFMSEKNQNNIEDLKKSLEYYKQEILTNDDINIKKNYEIIENRLKEQQNQDNKNNDNNQQENKDKKQSQNSDSEKDKNNNDNQQNNQSQDSKNQQNNDDNQGQDNKDNQNNKQNKDQNKNNQSNQNSNNNQNNLDRNNNEQNNFQENLDNSDKEKSKNNDQDKNQNSNSENEKERKNNKNSNSQNSSLDKPQQTKQQKELQLMLKNLEKNEKQSFKNNERLIGVENESDTKNRW